MTDIQTHRLLLRPIQKDDARLFASYCNDYSLARNTSRIPHPYSLAEAEAFVESSTDAWMRNEEYRFAICRDGLMVACAGLTPGADEAFELGYWVGADFRGDGIATEAVSALIKHGFVKLGAAKIAAGYFVDNPASGRVLEKLGFLKTGEIIDTMSIARGTTVETIRVALDRPLGS